MSPSSAPLYVVGLGPGNAGLLPPLALRALESCSVLAGYPRYLDLLDPGLLSGRKIIATGMKAEIERCSAALDSALGGEPTALVCSGDPGVYALAGLVLELMEERGLNARSLPLEVIPGIPAFCAAAALLGAPLMHDFASVSLSDLLTPWDLIKKRLYHALEGDFVLAIYNPRSRRRKDQLEEAMAMALAARGATTPVGLVRNAWREDQAVSICTLGEFDPESADMLSIVLVGNSHTRIMPGADGAMEWHDGARIVTPRGYMAKYRAGAVRE